MTNRSEKHSNLLTPARQRFLGGLLLIAAFIAQYWLYDDWNTRLAKMHAALTDRAVVDKSVLLNEVLYFVVPAEANLFSGLSGDDLRGQKISEAAKKAALGLRIAALSVGDNSTIAFVAGLMRKADMVRDFKSYVLFIQEFNSANDDIAKRLGSEINSVEQRKSRYQYYFLLLYGLGALLYNLGDLRLAGRGKTASGA